MGQAPAVGPLPAVALPRATRFKLSSGLDVVAVRRNVAPIVSAAFMFRSGAVYDPAGRTGVASITAEMLDEGAGPRDALAIAAELEQLGADLWLASGRDGSQLSVQAPRDTFGAAMAIAADVLMRPRLETADWQRVHNDRRTGVVQRRDGVVHVERSLLARQLGHEDGLQEEVADLFEERAAVAAVDRVDDFVRLFDDERLERLQRLFAVPRAAVGASQGGHELHEIVEGAWRHGVNSSATIPHLRLTADRYPWRTRC